MKFIKIQTAMNRYNEKTIVALSDEGIVYMGSWQRDKWVALIDTEEEK